MRVAAIVVFAGALVGCGSDTVVCGPGTLAVDGVCVPAVTVDDSSCGPGTHVDDQTGECLPDHHPTRCGGRCMDEVVADDGSITCECGAVGEPREGCHCYLPLACAAPEDGKVSICGQLYDAATGDAVVGERTAAYCDPDNPADSGACALQVSFFDALELAASPSEARPLGGVAFIEINDCGHVSAIGLEAPASGLAAVVVDELVGDVYARSVTVLAVSGGEQHRDVALLVLDRTTDSAWTAAAGDPFGGDSFVDRGVVLTRALSGGEPTTGIQLTCAGAPCDDAYYFADETPWTASTPDPALDRAGVNGAALSVAAGASPGVEGGLDASCAWPARIAAPIPGMFVSEEIVAHAAGDPATPCP